MAIFNSYVELPEGMKIPLENNVGEYWKQIIMEVAMIVTYWTII